MENLLREHLQIPIQQKVKINGKVCYISDEYIYGITSSVDNKVIAMEQTGMAYYLLQQQYKQTAYPIQNIKKQWLVSQGENKYLLLKIEKLNKIEAQDHGKTLAEFHRKNMSYPYEPKELSSYGKWRELWIEKLEFFEEWMVKEIKKNRHYFFRYVRDYLPYLIGLSENAISYVREAESESDVNHYDQGTIVFYRYKKQLLDEVICPMDLMFDHRTRDLAELIRYKFLKGESLLEIDQFYHQYESFLPLSPFSRHLFFARLLYPMHLFDCLRRAYIEKNYEKSYDHFQYLLKRQEAYEDLLKKFMHQIIESSRNKNLFNIHWL